MEKALTQAQKAQYQRDGYLFPMTAMDATKASDYRAQLEALEARYVDEKISGRSFNHYLRINAHLLLPLAAEIAECPTILDRVESILGPNLMVWSCEFFNKEASTDKIVSWHQDMTYWGLGESENGDTDNLVTAWLALSPATSKSGCMQFVAGSHKQTLQPHQDTFDESNLLSRGQEIAVNVAPEDAIDITLQPGEFSLHHGRTFHASGPNSSDDRRIGVAIRYVTPEVKQLTGARDYAMLVRGQDKYQNWTHSPRPNDVFEGEALAFYEQVLEDQAKVLAMGAEQSVGLYK